MSSHLSGSQNTKQEEVQNVWSSSRWGNTSFVKLGTRSVHGHWGVFPLCTAGVCAMLISFSFSLQNPLCLL